MDPGARVIALATLLGAAGCYHGRDANDGADPGADDPVREPGDADDGEGDGADDDGGGDVDAQCADDDFGLGAGPLQRLTRAEYDNSVRDLVGLDLQLAAAGFSDDGRVGVFAANGVAPPSELELEKYMDAAETIAEAATADLSALLPCDPAVIGEDACADAFVVAFGRRAFRRPLEPEELAAYLTLHAEGAAVDGFAHGIGRVVRAMLQSPSFLYRVEIGQPVEGRPGVMQLDHFELATRLSYFLWKSMPDDTLLDAAEAGVLGDRAALEEQARRMLEDPAHADQVRDTIEEFHGRWLELGQLQVAEKSAEQYPAFSPELVADMKREADAFVADVILEGDARVETLLTAPYTFVTPALAEIYGVPHPGPADALARVNLDPTRRGGVLSQPGLMTVLSHGEQTSPVFRGRWVREQLLCQPPAPPPPDVDDAPPEVDPDLPTKERLAQHRDNPSCSGCHDYMDPLGFGFEHYDPIGAWRDMDGNNPVDAVGEILGTVDIDGEFEGAVELGQRLASSEQVRGCMVKQWFRYANARFETTDDECTLDGLVEAFVESDGDVRELMVALVVSDAFRFRRLPDPEEGE